MVKKSKSPKQSKQTDARTEMRHLGVLIEHVGDDVKLVAEQYGDIKKTLNVHTEMIGKLAVDMEIVKEDLDVHTKMIGRLAVDVEIIKEDAEFIKNSLKKKVDVEEFAALERRVLLLEKRR